VPSIGNLKACVPKLFEGLISTNSVQGLDMNTPLLIMAQK